jgi:hypothetical protein
MSPNVKAFVLAIFRNLIGTASLCFTLSIGTSAQQTVNVVPTTTLATETGNNTGTSNSFIAQTNGNLGPGNVSKVAVGPLIGGNTPVFAHFMPWFGSPSHMNVGYDSADPAQIKTQVDDMISRGIQGAIVDWYGPDDNHGNTTTINLMTEAQSRNGEFSFAVMVDGGALAQCSITPACDLTTELVKDLNYAYSTFEGSSAYFHINGQPVVLFFDVERYAFSNVPQYTINWSQVVADVPGNPLFIFRNAGGFTHADSSGSFGWVDIDLLNPDDWGQTYLANFYSTGQAYPNRATFGASYKGFNDTLAAWGQDRIMDQNCGQTWLDTFAQINTQYSTASPLPLLQLVTWNDYEEGTELESGIDNCATATTSLTSTSLSWKLSTGSATTVDHYQILVGLDDTNLMPLATASAGSTSLDLTQYAFAPGLYSLFVKAVGLPSFRNQMSNPVHLSPGDQPPVASLSLSTTAGHGPLTVTASALKSRDPDGVITSYTIDFGDGTVVTQPTATHTYSRRGSYRVLATVFDNVGSSSAAAKVVTVVDTPPVAVINISPTSGTAPLAVTADASGSFDKDGTIIATIIDFGDRTPPVSATSAYHVYTATGTYNVKVTVTDNLGVSSSNTQNVTVAGPSVSIVTPTNGATVNSPTHVSATATAPSGRQISTMTLYVDGNATTTVSGANLDTYTTLQSATTHMLKVEATDTAGATTSSSIAIYAVQPETVTIWSPTNDSTVNSPVHVVASATSNHTVSAMQIYLDNVLYNTFNNVNSIDVYVPMTAGAHYLVVKAWTNIGTNFLSSAQITVASSSSSCLSTVAETVTICSPVDGSTVGSPVHVVASAASNYTVTAMQIYLDNVLYSTSNNVSSIDAYVPMAGGAHYLVVKAWTSIGTNFINAATVTVSSASCALSAVPERVTICSPANGSTVSSPVHVNAGATSNFTVTAMQIYLDNVFYGQANGSSIDTDVPISSGSHTIVVKAWTNLGTNFFTGAAITVQ